MSEKITFPIIDTDHRTVSEARDGVIELTDNYFLVFLKFISDEMKDDDRNIREKVIYHTLATSQRARIDKIRVFRDFHANRYCVQIDDMPPLYFETWSEGKEVYEKILAWRYAEIVEK